VSGTPLDAPSEAPDDAPVDRAGEDAVSASLCDSDPDLSLCFSFDQAPLPSTLPNEGTAAVDAQLINITRIPRLAGGAAQLAADSAIVLPMSTEVTNILAIEVWLRIDAEPPNGGRSGLVDSNISPPNISRFVYRQDPIRQLRCGLGGQVEVMDAMLPVDTWLYVACTCEADSLAIYVDGAKLGERPGACGSGGAFVADGFTIGSDNTGNPDAVGERLAGAIDGVRLWSTPRTAQQICATSGRPSC
jgi:hypothetical protein